MSYDNVRERYLENDVLSRTPEQLVPLLYEHLVLRLSRAVLQITQRDLAGKADSMVRAREIVLELAAMLDHEQGGEFAERMAALYAYMVREINAVERSLEQVRLQALVELIRPLHEAWTEAADQVRGRTAGAAPARVAVGR